MRCGIQIELAEEWLVSKMETNRQLKGAGGMFVDIECTRGWDVVA